LEAPDPISNGTPGRIKALVADREEKFPAFGALPKMAQT